MVKFINVSQDYGSFIALQDLSFDIPKNGLVALLGPNGAGKSTTMNIMTGFRPPLSGEVYINGINIFTEPEKAKACIGYLAENPPLYPELTVSEYLSFAAELRQLRSEEVKDRTKEVLTLLKIENRADTLIKNLSKGLKQRVGIAQSIIHNPKLLVLDEPTVGLEPSQLIEFRNLVRELAKEKGTTIVLSTHIMAEAAELCDQVIIINEGIKIFEGSKDQLLNYHDHTFKYLLKVVNLSKELLIILKDIKEVDNINVKNNELEVTMSQDKPEILIDTIVKSKVSIKYCMPITTSLEKAFLDLTIDNEKRICQ